MGYTNKTSHYELPQYIANDKPSWLGDFNAAMLKIDTVMADNDATAEAANAAATGVQTQVAALSSQVSTIQGQVNTAVDTATTADGKATTAQTVATQANTTAGEAKTLAEVAKTAADTATETANAAVPKSGGTMTGNLILNGAPTADNQAATKAYVDSKSGSVEITKFTIAANIISGNLFVGKIGNSVIISGAGLNPTQIEQNSHIATIVGNPFNLSNTNYIGGVYYNGGLIPLHIGFDSSSNVTYIRNQSAIPANTMAVYAGGNTF